MSTHNPQEGAEALEAQSAGLLELVRDKPAKDAWRKVVGMFADDPQIEELHRETQRIRELDRAATRDGSQGEV
jgi:hypothetical protein